jgi:hypothetical protein
VSAWHSFIDSESPRDPLATLVAGHKLSIPVLAIGAGGGELTFATMRQVSSDPVRS